MWRWARVATVLALLGAWLLGSTLIRWGWRGATTGATWFSDAQAPIRRALVIVEPLTGGTALSNAASRL